MTYLDNLNDKKAKQASIKDKQELLSTTKQGSEAIVDAVTLQSIKTRNHTQKVEVVNQPKVEVKHVNDYSPLVKPLEQLLKAVSKLPTDIKIPKNEKVESVSVNNLKDYTPVISELLTAIKAIDVKPQVNVAAPKVVVPETKIDVSALVEKVDEVVKTLKNAKPVEIPNLDLSPLVQAVNNVRDAVNGQQFPIPNYILPFKDPTTGKATQVTLSSDGKLPVDATFTGDLTVDQVGIENIAGSKINPATEDKQDDIITAIEAIPGGGGVQYTEGDTDTSVTGTAVMWEDASDTMRVVSASKPLPVDLQDASVAVTGTFWQATQPVSAAALPLPSGASTSAKQDTIIGHLDGVEALLGTIDTDTGNIDTKLGDLSKAEDAAHSTGDKGVMALSVRKDSPTALAGTDGDYAPLEVDATGRLHVTHEALDDLADGSVELTAFQGGPWDVGITGDVGVLSQFNLTNSDPLATALVDSNGDRLSTIPVSAASLPLPSGASTSAKQDTIIGHLDGVETTLTTIDGRVDGLETSNSAIQTSVELIDDTVKTLGTDTYTEATTKGLVIGAVRRDADTTLVNTTNEVAPLQVDANGRLKVEAFSGETLPVSLTSTTVTGTVAVTQSGTWDEVGINDSGNSITVDNGGTFAVQVDGAALTALQLIDDSIATTGSAVTAKATLAAGTDGTNARALKTDTNGELQIDVLTMPTVSITANSAVNVAQMNGTAVTMGNGAAGTGVQRVSIASDSTGQVAPAANATATGTAIYNNTALSNTKQAANASAGNLYGYHIYNPNSVVIYVQFFNVASGSVTVGTTAPTMVIAVPPGGWADATPGTPIAFGTAMTIAATTTSTGSGAPTTALLCNLWYK